MAKRRVLVIDDDVLFLEIARATLDQCGFSVMAVSDAREGVNLAIEHDFDLILLDLVMPNLQGEEVLRLLKPIGGPRIAVVSAHTGAEYRNRARDLGAVGYLEKPVSAPDLCRVVTELLGNGKGPEEKPKEGFPAKNPLDTLATWVFGVGPVTPAKRVASLGVVGGLGGVLVWLIWG